MRPYFGFVVAARTKIFIAISIVILLSSCADGVNETSRDKHARAPQNIIANPGSRIVNVQWEGVPGATSYSVYWQMGDAVDSKEVAQVQSVPNPYFEHHNLTNGWTYYYRVSAHTSKGESDLSPQVQATPTQLPPNKPIVAADGNEQSEGFRGFAGNGRVTLLWSNQISEGASRYAILWRQGGGVSPDSAHRIDDVASPFVHEGLENGQMVSYRLVAVNDEGDSEPSEEISVTPQAVQAYTPTGLSATAGDGQITITWDTAGAAESYELYWSTTAGVSLDSQYIGNIRPPFTHAPLSNNQTYYYRVRSIIGQQANGQSASALSGELHATAGVSGSEAYTPPVGITPQAPASVTLEPGDGQVLLQWEEVGGAAGYVIYWNTSGNVLTTDARLTPVANVAWVNDINNNSQRVRRVFYVHTGLQNGQEYYYRVAAFNDVGQMLSDQATVQAEKIVPGRPANVHVVGGDQWIGIRWNPVRNAESYNIYWKSSSYGSDTNPGTLIENVSPPFKLDSGYLLGSEGGFNGSTIPETVTNGIEYEIRVEAVPAGGSISCFPEQSSNPNVASKPSPCTQGYKVTPQIPPPVGPADVRAIPGDGRITIQWQSINDPVDVYHVYWGDRSGQAGIRGRVDIGAGIPSVENRIEYSQPHLGRINGKRYYYVVTAVNAGGESPPSKEVWAIANTSKPQAPIVQNAKAADKQVSLTWRAPDSIGNYNYNIYYRTAGSNSSTVIPNTGTENAGGSTNERTFSQTVSGLSNNVTYYFKVSAISDGGEGVFSSEVNATPFLPPPQQAPANFQANAGDRQVALSWNSTVGADFYNIYWSTTLPIDLSEAPKIRAINTTTYNHTQRINGMTYYYRVVAANAGGEGAPTDMEFATPNMPKPDKPPSNFTVVSGDSQVRFDWQLLQGAQYYHLYWSRDLNMPINQWARISGVEPGFVQYTLENGSTYHYYLRAGNAGGEGPASTIVSVTPQQPVPTAPAGFSVSPGDTLNIINWDTQAGVTYNLYWSTSPAITVGSNVIPNVTPTYLHTKLNNSNTIYYYRLAAVNDVGQGPLSQELNADPEPQPLNAPTGVSAQGRNGEVELRWFAPTDAPSSVTYTIYWSTSPGTGTAGNRIANVSSPYFHLDLDNGATYYYVVTANNDLQNNTSLEVSATPSYPAAGMPANPYAQAGVGEVTVSWSTTSNAQWYVLDWSTDAGFANAQSVVVNAPATEYRHENLSNGTTYYYRISAANAGGQSSASAIVSATPSESPNQEPVIDGNETVEVAVNQAGNFDIGFSARDANGDSLSWSIDQAPTQGNSTFPNSNTGNNVTVNYAHAANNTNSDSFWVRVDDGRGGFDRVRILVSVANGLPVAQDDVYTVDEGQQINVLAPGVLANDSDPDSDALNVQLIPVTDPVNGTVTLYADGSFNYAHDGSETISDSFEYRISDGAGSDTAIVNITINPQNDVPTLDNPIADQGAQQNVLFNLQVPANTFNDADGDNLSYSATLVDGSPQGAPLPTWLSFDTTTRTFTGTPQNSDVTGASGIDIKVTVDDNNQGVISDVFNLIVVDTNDPPTDIGLSNNTVGENVANGTVVGVLSAVDPDVGDSHTFTITSDSSNGGFGIQGNQLVVADTNRLDYETSSTHSVFLQVADRFNISLPQPKEFIITLVDQNDPPEIILPPLPITVVENSTAVITLQGNDQDGDPVSFDLAGGVDAAQFVLLSANELHFVGPPDFEAPADANGDNIFELLVNISDGVGPSVTTPISVEVVDTPEAPVITSSAILNATQGQLYQYDVQAIDDDLVHGDNLIFSLTQFPAGMSIDPDTGLISWTPTNAQVASSPHDVNVHVQDNGGLFDDQPFQIAVIESNERPTDLQLDNTQIGENVPPGTSVGRFTVTDPDIGDSHDLSIVEDPSNAFAIGGANSDELIVSAPENLDFETVPAVTIQVQATDRGGLGINPIPSFTITILNQNDPPVLLPQAFSVLENTINPQPNRISFSDEDQTDNVSVSITGGPDAGLFSLAPDTGELTFQAAPNFETPTDANQDNVYLIQVTANDGSVPVVSQMTITVSNANDQPQPGDDTYTVDEGNSISIPDLQHQPPFDDLLSNDVDEDGDPLIVSLLSGPAHSASFTLNPDGSFTYTHDGSETTIDTFAYSVDDKTGEPNATANATVTIDVTPQNDPPEIVDPAPNGQVTVSMAEDGYNVSLDQAEPFVLTLNANDPENNPLTWNISANPNNGSASVIGDNTIATINYTPNADYNGQDQFEVLVDDQMGGTDTIQVIVDISPQNDTPLFPVLPAQSHFEGETIASLLDASATDVDGDTLVYSATGLPPSLAIDPNTGQVSGTIDIGAVGDYTNIVIYANDQSGMPNAQAQSVPFSWSVLFNQNPVADITQPVDGITVNINEDIILDASGSGDPDNHVPLDYQWNITGPANFVTNGVTATVSFPGAGVYNIDLMVTDSLGKQGQASITINVNTPPSGATLNPATVPENSPTATIVGTLSAIDPDIGDTHTFTMATGGDAGGRFSISGNQVMVADGSLLNYEVAGSHEITVEVRDLGGTGTPVNQTLTINVTDANDPPVITYPTQQPRQQITNTDGDLITFVIYATDEDAGDILRFDATSLPPGLTIDPAGVISGTLDVGATVNSPYIIDFTVDDQQGQPNSTTPGSFEWQVNPLPLAGLFANPALESCLLSYGWTNAHEVTGTITCEGQSITELDGMEYLVNVNELQLSNNQITDLSPLKGLANLQVLNVSNNQISDLSNLGATDLAGLNTLYLNGNPVQDISGLKDLSGLIELRLSALTATVTNASDIAGLTEVNGFSNLEILWLQDNSLTDISGLENRSNLKELWISGNTLSDISAISSLSNLTVLDLGSNIIEDVSGLELLTNLTWLDLNNNTIGASVTGNIDKLASLANVQTLDLTNNPLISCRQLQTLIDTRGASPTGPVSPGAPIPGSNCTEPLASLFTATNSDLQSCMDQLMIANQSWLFANDVTGTFACNNMTNGDLSGMEYLVNLTGFEANNSNISDISLLAGLTKLTILRLDGNNITDLSAFASTDGTIGITPLLQELHLANNSGINDFSPLALLNQLTYLDLENTGIDDISVLSGNVALVTLNLNNNQIQDVTGLGSLTALQKLLLANNQIKDVNSLASLVNLVTLDLQGNQIGNGVQGFVDRLSTLTLATVNLTNNPVISCGELQLLYNSPTRPVVVGATCTELPADPDKTTATLIKPHDPLLRGDRVTLWVQARDVYGNPKTQGGDKVDVTITGANPATFTLDDNLNGLYAKVYWVYNAGTDYIEITLGDPGQPIKGDYADGIYTEFINTPPTASIIQPTLGSMDIWPGTQVTFEATAADAEDTLGNGLTVEWVFDGGDIPGASALGPHTITFSTAGKYTITFTATDSIGTSSPVISKTIVVGDPWGASQPELIESIDSAAQQPKITIDNANNVIAAWAQNWPSLGEQNITVNRYDAGPGVWEGEQYIDTDVRSAFNPQIVMTSNGDAVVVWAQSDAYPYSTIWSNRYNRLTSNWETPIQVDSNATAASEFNIAQNNLGDVMAIWHETDPVSSIDNILVNRYSFGSGLWGLQPELVGAVSTSNSVYKTAISISDSGDTLALWSENISGGNRKIYGNSFISGNGWGTETVLEPDQGTSDPPQLTIFDNGDGLAVWTQNVRTVTGTIIGQALMASRYSISSDSWGSVQQVHYQSGYYDSYIQSALDNNGNVTILWMANRSPPIPDHLFSIRYNSNTGVWGTVQQVDQYGMGNQYPALAVDTLGNVIAVWHSPNKYSVWANKYDINTQTWGVPKLLENDDSGLAGDAQIVIGSDDVGVVVWRQEFGNNVYDVFSTRLDPQP